MTATRSSESLLRQAARIEAGKVLATPQNRDTLFRQDTPVLIVLAAGKGTRFGKQPKCIQPVLRIPLAKHTVDAFRRTTNGPVICVVGYRHDDVTAALGAENLYVLSDNPVGGTAYAAAEAFCVPGLLEANPPVVVTMGDRVITPSIFRRLLDTHQAGGREADLTLLTAQYEPPRQTGRGRILRGEDGLVERILEQNDIDVISNPAERTRLQGLTEANCPLYAFRAATLHRVLGNLTNANAQNQYYLTDAVAMIRQEKGEIRTVTTTAAEPEYDVLCSDVTRPADLALLEGILAARRELLTAEGPSMRVDAVSTAEFLAANRPATQTLAMARQLEELETVAREAAGFDPKEPVAVGVSGGRLRIAFMHPDMARFYGPAWQMPIGAGDADGNEQIVVLTQTAHDGYIHLAPTNPKYREALDTLPCDADVMFPPDSAANDSHAYEAFGTKMSEHLLLALGYFSEKELDARRASGLPMPPPSLWVSHNMRRPFTLAGNAIGSLRTLRAGAMGARVQQVLGRDTFRGLRLAITGGIPQGGFASSSALAIAIKNAINALHGLGIPPDLLVHLACQAEYGTGVRAGSLDQATVQKGRAGQGTLIASNPRDNYRILGAYKIPADRIRILFPYSVPRDRDAWRWSWGLYAESPGAGALTAGEMRKLTGKAAELAAVLTQLPFETDFFKEIEDDLLDDGELEVGSRRRIAQVLRQVPLLARRDELRECAEAKRGWLIAQAMQAEQLPTPDACRKTEQLLAGLFAGWRDPVLRRPHPDGRVIAEQGVPLRAMLAYLYAEVARNFYLVHHPEAWIACVAQSQRGDRCLDIDPDLLPDRRAMETEFPWEADTTGPDRMACWLRRFEATPFDFNQDIDDASLGKEIPPDLLRIRGGSFFRGLALLDLVEAMLIRAFGANAVAVRVNAAGQGDFFQVHVDTQHADPEAVIRFLRLAFFRRFGLSPDPDIVAVHPGGGAAGARLDRLNDLPTLVARLRELAEGVTANSTPMEPTKRETAHAR